MTVLVTGGAGYIGSVTVALLRACGERVVVLDNLVRGHAAALDSAISFYKGDVGDRALVGTILREQQINACIHFAAFAYVGESVASPESYFENNISQGIALLSTLIEHRVPHFILSSSCATYGQPSSVPIKEDTPQWPTNPYGWSKFIIERILESYQQAHRLRFVALRYFNAAGAWQNLGEHHEPETHLIPNVLAVARGELPHVAVYGTDYATPDGTAVRDYVHVHDLATAHILALRHLREGKGSQFLNVGTGRGFSVLEVIESARRVTGQAISITEQPRRFGDPAQLVAEASQAAHVLGWAPEYRHIDEIIRTAWEWHVAHPHGYPQ